MITSQKMRGGMHLYSLPMLACLLALLTGIFSTATTKAEEPALFYSYQGKSGRTVYVNRIELVPKALREGVKRIDVSQISLNTELGAEINAAIQTGLQDLKKGDVCAAAVAERNQGNWKHIWHRHGPWILLLATTLLLVVVSPWMARRLPQGAWMRTLMFVIPMLGMVTLLALAGTRMSDSLIALRNLATFCGSESSGEQSTTAGANQLTDLRSNVRQLYADRFRTLDATIEMAEQ